MPHQNKTISSVLSLTEQPTSKSIDDILQQSNLIEAITSAVSTRTQPSGKAISDISIPTSEKYGAPADIRLDGTVSKGIPMNMKKIADALSTALTSPEYVYGGDISQKEIAEQSLGELLGMTADFNRKREGRKLIQDMLEKFNVMNKPGGLVAYRTEEGLPTGGGKQVTGVFKRAESPESPDTIAIFGDKSSIPEMELISKLNRAKTLLHEGIHAGSKEGTPLRDMGPLRYHQKRFDKSEEDIIETHRDEEFWIANMLYNAMMDKESEGAKLLKGFIK